MPNPLRSNSIGAYVPNADHHKDRVPDGYPQYAVYKRLQWCESVTSQVGFSITFAETAISVSRMRLLLISMSGFDSQARSWLAKVGPARSRVFAMPCSLREQTPLGVVARSWGTK